MLFGTPASVKLYSLLHKPVEISNYSQTQIKISVYPLGLGVPVTTDYLFDKHAVNVRLEGLPSDPTIPATLFVVTQPESYVVQFDYINVISPLAGSPEELFNIINGWLVYVSGVSINGGTSTGLLNTINLIEGPNITITATSNTVANVLDVTVSAPSSSGDDPFPKILMLMGG